MADDLSKLLREIDTELQQRQAEEGPQAPRNAEGNSGVFQTVDDVVRRMANAATFGYADKWAAAADQATGMTGEAHGDLPRQRMLTEDAGQRLGKGAIVADIAGGVGGALAGGALVRGGAALAGAQGVTAPARALLAADNAGIAGRTAVGAADGLMQSGLDAAGRDTAWTPQNALTAAGIGGGVAGGLAALGRARLPSTLNEEEQRAVQVLRDQGIDLTAGQAGGRRWVKNAESELGRAPLSGQPGPAFAERQAEQVNRAVSRSAGTEVPRFSPEGVDRMLGKFDEGFGRLVKGNNTRLDDKFMRDISAVENAYAGNLDEVQKPIFARWFNQLKDTAKNPSFKIIPAEWLHNAQMEIGRLRRTKTDPELQEALKGLQNAVLDTMKRSMPTSQAKEFGQLREQYRNWMAVENALRSSSAAGGNISPMALGQATMAQGSRNVLKGDGSATAKIARAAQAVMKPVQDSGTAGRNMAIAVPSAGVTAAGLALAGQLPAAAGMAAGAAAPGLAGRLLFSNPAQRFLGASLPQQPAGSTYRGVLGGLYGSGAMTPDRRAVGPQAGLLDDPGPLEITVNPRRRVGG